MSKFKSNLYFIEKIVRTPEGFRYKQSDDGTLFSGVYRTKITEEELPEWYVRGRYYKQHGYLSVKGIKDLLYVPNKIFNHFLKDDYLLVSYKDQITENPNRTSSIFDKHIGWDQRVWGGDLLRILHGAKIYSDYDISEIIEQIKDKREWLREHHPFAFEHECNDFDADEYFQREFDNGHPPKFYALTLNDCFSPAYVSGDKKYYGSLKDIKNYIDSLDPDKHKDIKKAFDDYMSGKENAKHYVAFANRQLLTPVKTILQSFFYKEGPAEWDFKNVWGFTYKMKYKSTHALTAIIRDGDKYIRCIKPTIKELACGDESNPSEFLTIDHFWGNQNLLKYEKDWQDRDEIISALYFAEREYDDAKSAVRGLDNDPLDLNIICEDIFADG